MNEEEIKQLVIKTIKEYDLSSAFTHKQVADTPTDALSVVNRKWLTLNGAVASRPVSSIAVIGQPYLATDTSIPMTYTAAGWVNGVGSVVALNN